ncbi:hypothetical protein UK23_39600 [Lentzea aerocolonigenes]|uniref:Uncharacterized protein n=1 Tax=Lentzea aerocolonigenes TaxID=68170 RepID=A0A0F0GHH2_LENAE|nr:hypothetical protein [Lentzea aerocolonigenes]KJK41936.1 hypothetical protein UK23_39600 [Lentzea aerocolonigenes]
MNWGTVVWGAALTALALLNDQLHWLPPLQFAGLAIAVLLIVVAPRPAWVALVIAGITAVSMRSVVLMVNFEHEDDFCLNGGALCSFDIQPGWYSVEEPYAPFDAKYLFELPVIPAWLIVLGVLGWAARRRSWRTAVAGAVYGVAVATIPYYAPIVLFAAAAAAIGARKDVRYLAGIGILMLVLMDQHQPWSLVATFVAVVAALGLGIRALVKKDGVNGLVALASLAAAAVSPLLSAGVLLVTSAIRQPLWFKLLLGAISLVVVDVVATSLHQPTGTGQMMWIDSRNAPVKPPLDFSAWQILAGVLLAGAAVAALYQHRHRVESDQAKG